jgi:hypothetical protein
MEFEDPEYADAYAREEALELQRIAIAVMINVLCFAAGYVVGM